MHRAREAPRRWTGSAVKIPVATDRTRVTWAEQSRGRRCCQGLAAPEHVASRAARNCGHSSAEVDTARSNVRPCDSEGDPACFAGGDVPVRAGVHLAPGSREVMGLSGALESG